MLSGSSEISASFYLANRRNQISKGLPRVRVLSALVKRNTGLKHVFKAHLLKMSRLAAFCIKQERASKVVGNVDDVWLRSTLLRRVATQRFWLKSDSSVSFQKVQTPTRHAWPRKSPWESICSCELAKEVGTGDTRQVVRVSPAAVSCFSSLLLWKQYL